MLCKLIFLYENTLKNVIGPPTKKFHHNESKILGIITSVQAFQCDSLVTVHTNCLTLCEPHFMTIWSLYPLTLMPVSNLSLLPCISNHSVYLCILLVHMLHKDGKLLCPFFLSCKKTMIRLKLINPSKELNIHSYFVVTVKWNASLKLQRSVANIS